MGGRSRKSEVDALNERDSLVEAMGPSQRLEQIVDELHCPVSKGKVSMHEMLVYVERVDKSVPYRNALWTADDCCVCGRGLASGCASSLCMSFALGAEVHPR